MRVLHVYSGNLYGGIESILVTSARCRAQCPSMEPVFALCFPGRLSREFAATGAAVHVLGETRLSRPLSIWRARKTLKRLTEAIAADVVVCHSEWSHALFGAAIRQVGVPLVYAFHGPLNRRDLLGRVSALTPPDLRLFNSRFTAMSVRHNDHIPMKVVYNPVERRQIADPQAVREEVRDTLGVSPGSRVIIQVSRMQPFKGHEALFRALELLVDVPNWVCWIVGGAQRKKERAYLERLQQVVTRLGIADRVRFLGERDDVHRLFAGADLFCQSNQEPEPFGVSFVEALLAGIPVVTFAMGGATEIIDRSCGVLVPRGDCRALSEGIRGFLTESGDQSHLREATIARGQALCDPARQLNQRADVLSTVVA